MTRDEILNMPGGADMNLMIANKIMNWILIVCSDGKRKYCESQDCGEYTAWNEVCGVGDFEPSTDIAAAWEVAEKFGIAVIPQSAEDGFRWLAMDVKKVSYYGSQLMIEENNDSAVSAETAPLAICRAALLATMAV